MDVREKLVKLVEYMDGVCPSGVSCYNCPHEDIGEGCSIQAKVDYLIKGGVTVQKWIPVTERLPDDTDGEFYDSVAIALKNGKVAIGCYRNADREWWVDCLSGGYRDVTNEITYWMPLPEAPKGE